ncbi:MAG: class I SAM-dependent methyltransferase family protein [Candidatus Woesearchaeota archaeon]
MSVIRVPAHKAQKVKESLIRNKLLDSSRTPRKDGDDILFPVTIIPKGFKPVNARLKKKSKLPTFKDAASKVLSKEELKHLNTAYDTAGSIAIVDIFEELEHKKKQIGKALLESNPRIQTVLRRGTHEGEFRTQTLELLAGKKTKEAIFHENGVRIKTNLETVYYSVRLSTERKRITELVKPGERVLVMFSGAGPYVCAIAKNTAAKEVVGVEINPEGHKYAEENVKLNKLKNVKLYCGDAGKVVPKLGTFDRVLMPLPKSSEEFLDTAIKATKPGAVIHFYHFYHENDFKEAERVCKEACKRNKRTFKKLAFVKCGQYAPGEYRTCLDFEVR